MMNSQRSDAEKISLIEEGKKILMKLLSIMKSLITVQNNTYKYKNEIVLLKGQKTF